MGLLLKGGRVIDPSQNLDAVQDIRVEDGKILEIGQNLTERDQDQVLSLSDDVWVTPGLIDIHVHLRDPGQEYKETIASGTEAAIAGGFTAVACMPNTSPVLDNVATLEYVKNTAFATAKIPVYPICAATKNIAGEELTEMGELHARGAVGFSDDGHCVMNSRVMLLILEYLEMFGLPFISHAEDTNLSAGGCMHEGYYSTLLGLPGIPSESESIIVARDIQLAKRTGAKLHIAHVSTKESVALIRQAKAEGVRITAETTPHYLALTDEAICDYDANCKMNPPLRSQADQEALIEGLMDGTIDAIATDHAPHHPDEKANPFDCCPNGVIGLETSLGIVLTRLFHQGGFSPSQIVAMMSCNPARIINVPGGTLAVGSPADITVIDPKMTWTVDPKQFKSKSRNTPFAGWTLQGKAMMTISKGNVLMSDPVFMVSARQNMVAATV